MNLSTQELIFIKSCLESREYDLEKALKTHPSMRYVLEQDLQRIKFITKKIDYMIRNAV